LTSDQEQMILEADELQGLRAEFPAYLFSQEQLPDRERYTARGRSLAVSPHTVISSDLAELEKVLRDGETGHDDAGNVETPRSLLTAAQDLMARTAELPDGRRELLAVLSEYRHALFALAVENYQP
jgi:hypothetical protein